MISSSCFIVPYWMYSSFHATSDFLLSEILSVISSSVFFNSAMALAYLDDSSWLFKNACRVCRTSSSSACRACSRFPTGV